MNIPAITSLTDGETFNFKTPASGNSTIYEPKIQLNDFGVFNIDQIYPLKDNTSYYVVFHKDSSDTSRWYYLFLGEVSPSGYAEDDNPSSPFYVNSSVGKIGIILNGGEYDNIYTTQLAQQRAEYELYKRAKIYDNVTLNVAPLYWCDVNKLISITLPTTNQTNQYLIKSINTTLDINGTQNINMMRFYPEYPPI